MVSLVLSDRWGVGSAGRRGVSAVVVLGCLVAATLLAVMAVLLLRPAAPTPVDPAVADAEVQELARKVSLAVEHDRDTAPLLEPAARLAARLDGHAGAHTLYGQVLMHNGRLEEASGELRRALAIDPDRAEAHNLLGSVLVKLGDLPAAQSSYRQAIGYDAENPDHRVKLANTLWRAGAWADAERVALEALKLNSNRHQAHVILSHVAEARGQWEVAQQRMADAIDALPGEQEADRMAYTARRAMLLRRDNRPQDALAVLRQLPPEFLFRMSMAEDLARTFGMMGQPALAAVHFETISDLEPVNAAAAAAAADWYLRAGLQDAARSMVDRVARINPRHRDLPALRAKLAGS